MSKQTGSFREQIAHWRERALVAEAANANAAKYVDEERKRAEGAIAAAGSAAAKYGQALYMAGADAAGMRSALEGVVELLQGGELRRPGWTKAKREAGRDDLLARLRGALSGEAGKQIREEVEALDAQRKRLAAFADAVDALVAKYKEGPDDLVDELGDLLVDLDSAIRDDLLDTLRKGTPGVVGKLDDALDALAKDIGVTRRGAEAERGADDDDVLDALAKEGA